MTLILYIDDDDANRRLVQRILLAEGFEVEESNSAIQGIDKAKANPPDLILMDISMPDMNGLEATGHIRSNPKLSHIKVVALTANAMHGDREMILEAGCDGYISKPINIDTFVEEISQFL